MIQIILRCDYCAEPRNCNGVIVSPNVESVIELLMKQRGFLDGIEVDGKIKCSNCVEEEMTEKFLEDINAKVVDSIKEVIRYEEE